MPAAAPPIVVVTGCSAGGIGYHLCQQYADRGCVVYATARNPDALLGLPPTVRLRTLDVTSDNAVNAVVQDVIDAEGRIDIVVNNAGMICIGPIADVDAARVQTAFDTNVFAPLRVARAVIPHMATRNRGLIVNVGSVVGETPTPWNGVYCATKAALHSLSMTLKMECAPFNIRVMVVLPGSVQSNISSNQAAHFHLPESSLYAPTYLPGILKRMNASQTMRSMPTDQFAKQMVDATLKHNPPFWVMLGGNLLFWRVLRWVPRSLALYTLWRVFRA